MHKNNKHLKQSEVSAREKPWLPHVNALTEPAVPVGAKPLPRGPWVSGCSQALHPIEPYVQSQTAPGSRILAYNPPPLAAQLGAVRYLRHNALLAGLLPPHHGVGLPSPRLSVGKDAHIVAFKGVEQHLLPDVPVHLLLRRKLRVLYLVK